MKRRFFLITALLWIVCQSRAQPIYMQKIEHSNGIQAHDIYSVFEDGNHYLWFTTDGGIWRFDGKHYKNFTTEDGLPDNVVFLFYEDDKNRKWFNTYSNKLAYIEKDSVHTLACNDALSQLKKNEIPAGIYVDKKGSIYLTYFRSKNYLLITPPYKKKDIQMITPSSENEFFSIEIESRGMLSGSLDIENLGNKNRQSMTFIRDAHVTGYMIDSASVTQGLRTSCSRQYDNSFLVSADDVLGEYKNGCIKKLVRLKYTILSALKDSYHNYWISTIDGGLFFYRNTDSTFSHPQIYLEGKTVGRVMQDHEGAYWITMLNNGIYYIPHVDLSLTDNSHNLSDNLNYLYSDPASGLLFCMDAEGFLFALKDHKILKTINCNLQPDKPNLLKKIVPLNMSSYLFLGRHSFTLDTRSWKVNYIHPLDAITAASDCNQNVIWVSKQRRLLKIKTNTLKIESERTFETKINAIYVLNENIIWLGTERGLIKYNCITGKTEKTPKGIGNEGIISIIQLQPGKNLIIYKSDGILIVDDHLKVIGRLQVNIRGYSIKHAVKDIHKTIWISTNKGILRIDSGMQVTNIDEDHGLPSNIINAISADAQTVHVASEKGLVEFPVKKSFFNPSPPDIYLDSVIINNSPSGSDTVFHLQYDQNFVRIFFTTINYRESTDIICRYKMEGVDREWKITKNDEIEYTTLPPGNYTLTIYAINNDQISSIKKIHLYFFISPPFWKTWWFIAAGIVLIIASVVILFKWRVSLIRKRTKERSNLQEQLGQMEMQALRSQMNPHFIFNSINSIQHYILTNEPILANKFLVKFAKLIRNVLEQSKQELIPLKEEIETLRFYIEIESLRFEDSFSYTLNIADAIDQAAIKIPSLVLQPYVENAIWHGLLLKKGNKELRIHIEEKSGYLIVEIDDNGIGRKAAAVFENKEIKKQSLGMEITQNRLNLLSKSQGLTVEVNIIDKVNAGGDALGTTVIITLPLLS